MSSWKWKNDEKHRNFRKLNLKISIGVDDLDDIELMEEESGDGQLYEHLRLEVDRG